MRKWILYLLSMLIATTLWSASALPVITVGTVVDAETSDYIKMEAMLNEELKTLTQGTFEIDFTRHISADWSIQKAQRALVELQNNNKIDILITFGLVSARAAYEFNTLKKPTFAPYLLQYNQQTSGNEKKNLNYLAYDLVLNEALTDFLNVTGFTRLTLLTDDKLESSFPEVLKNLQKITAQKGIQLYTLTCTSAEDNPIAAVASDTEAVMLTPLPTLSQSAKETLIQSLIDKHLPSYALGNDLTVEDGVMMSSLSSENRSRRIRQLALNIQSVLRGEQITAFPVTFNEDRQLNINIATADSIGVYPPLNVLRQANLFGEDNDAKDNTLSLSDVAKLAIKNNLYIIAGELAVKAEDETLQETRSVLFPQITGNFSYIQQNSDNVYVKNGFYAEKSSSGAIRFHQILFSEKALAALEIQKKMKAVAQAQQRTLELDIVERATTLFLNTLIAQTHLSIEEENMKMTEANMRLARGRVDAGISDISDLYHWESRIATSNQRLLEAKASVEKARDALNLILNRPITQHIKTAPATLDDPDLLISHKPLLSLISNEKDYRLINDFFVSEGLKAAPELHLLNNRISAQARQLKSERKAYIMPDIVITGELNHVFEEERNPLAGFNLEDQTNWQAGLSLSLPLYEGGAKDARISRSRLGLQQLKLSRQEQQNSIEQQIRQDLHALRASYPSITFSKEAADAAHKSFQLVRDNYAEGTRPMTDLLVAQNASILAEQASANAVYRFLIDLMYLQRDIGQFDFFMNKAERISMINRLTSQIKSVKTPLLQPTKVLQ